MGTLGENWIEGLVETLKSYINFNIRKKKLKWVTVQIIYSMAYNPITLKYD